MVTRIGGARRKTRHQFKKFYRNKGKISLSKYFRPFKAGDKVIIKPEPAYQSGLCSKRYFGKTAIVSKKQGQCYEITLSTGNKQKKLILHPIHLAQV